MVGKHALVPFGLAAITGTSTATLAQRTPWIATVEATLTSSDANARVAPARRPE